MIIDIEIQMTLGFRVHEHIPEDKDGQGTSLPVFIFILTRMKPLKGVINQILNLYMLLI